MSLLLGKVLWSRTRHGSSPTFTRTTPPRAHKRLGPDRDSVGAQRHLYVSADLVGAEAQRRRRLPSSRQRRLNALICWRLGKDIASCYIRGMAVTDVKAVRQRFKLTQVQVAERAGVKQPEVSAVENGTRSTPGARERTLKAIRELATPSDGLTAEVRARTLDTFMRFGASDVRLFGSVATGTDGPGSDIDFIATFPSEFSLFAMFDLQDQLEDIIGLPVDVVADDPRGGRVLAAINADAVPFVVE